MASEPPSQWLSLGINASITQPQSRLWQSSAKNKCSLVFQLNLTHTGKIWYLSQAML